MSDKENKPRRRRAAHAEEAATSLFEGYSKTERPLGGYAVLVGVFTVALSGILASTVTKSEDEAPELNWSDLLLLGIATHKLSRVVTKDLVTSPFRAPFVKFKKSAGAGEVEEEARGEGIQEAVGDLITCPYCMAPWLASALVFGFQRAPRTTRVLSGIFCITAASDFLNQLYVKAKE
ncbi:MAG: DUF1360 domain-containing protein [Verrucomicrobiota bacterium]|nr:DUF1360 domain-containing protein [Verrucomicrobiota bacterium]